MNTTRIAAIGVIALILTAVPTAHAQFTGSYQTNVISGVSSNWSGQYIIGYSGVFDQLQIVNAGILSSDSGEVGFDASHNSAVVNGGGSVWSNSSDLFIGEGIAASFNSLVITNGGAVYNADVYLGRCELCGGGIVNSNSVIVTDTGSVWSNRGNVYLGSSGADNSLTITDGATVYNGDCYLRGTNATVHVAGNGAMWWNRGNLYVGISYWGGVVSNRVTVDLGGSVLVLTNAYIGCDAGSIGNQINVTGGDLFVLGNTYVGYDTMSTGSQINVTSGDLYVTNATHNAVLEVWRGQVTLSAGLLKIDVLTLTNASGHFVHTGGTLSVTSTNISANLDADGDGLPNGWEQAHGFDPFDPTATNGANGDPDGDGFTNLQEFYGGSDPTNNSSVPFLNYWNVSSNGKWELGADWILGVPPVSDEAVFLTNAATKTVTIDATTTNSLNAMTISNLVVSGPTGTTNTLKLANAGTATPLIVRNSCIVNSGGALLVTNAALRVDSNLVLSSGSVVLQADGMIAVTNGNHNAILDVRCGQFTQVDGLLQVDVLVITNACGRFNRSGGTVSASSLVLASNLDADGDGLPNGWEQAHNLDPLDSTSLNGANGDPDGDGFVNLEEYQAGTDPNDPDSKPSLPPPPNFGFQVFAIARKGNNVRITWVGSGGTTNVVQATNGTAAGGYTNNFADISQSMILSGSGPTTASYLDIGGATNKPSRFYRVRLAP